MSLIGMRNVTWGFSNPPLLEDITLQIKKGDRVCLLGRNGSGKSTLLRLFNGKMLPDSGDIWKQQGLTIATMEQNIPSGYYDGTVFDIIAQGLGKKGKALAEYNRICKISETMDTPELTRRRDECQHILDTDNGWTLLRQTKNTLSRTGLDPDQRFQDLSAGMKRRTLFARAIALEPDLLLLDEPTNHLDIESIIWMEEFILHHIKTLLFITHDRAFLKKISNRIMELDRGDLVSHDCDYEKYLETRQAAFVAEEKQNKVFDKKLSNEETWIRQGIKARRTRNQGRVRTLIKMREAFWARRKKMGTAKIQTQEAEKTGKLVLEANSLSYSYGEMPLIHDFSTTIMRGDKVGIIGPNGVGKTTLLKILLKDIAPDSGNVRHGTNLHVAYFDQLRAQLDEQKTLQENIADGNSFIIFNGKKRHITGYLQDFLFSPKRCRTPVYVLSGGEKNRLLLAKLFIKPANVLVMDEPTNDLDVETMELLEELIFVYKGTILLVSHDRAFLNNIVTSSIVFEGNGHLSEYAGGYDDWLTQRPPEILIPPKKKPLKKTEQSPKPPKFKKLPFKEKQELEDLPKRIDALELKHKDIYESMCDPLFYKKGKKKILEIKAHLNKIEHEIEAAYLRWEELDLMDSLLK